MTTNSNAPGPVIPERYVKSLGDRDPIDAMNKAPKRVRKLVRDRSEKELAWKPAADKWSIKEVLAHLADGEVILGARMRFVAAMENPPLPGYDQDLFVARLGLEKTKSKDLLRAFEAMRELNVALLRRLPKDAFARVGLHAERGPESIQKMVGMYAGHDFVHEAQIERVLGEMKASTTARKGAKAVRKAEKKAARDAEKALKKARKAEKKARKDRAPKKGASSDVVTPRKSDAAKEKPREPAMSGR